MEGAADAEWRPHRSWSQRGRMLAQLTNLLHVLHAGLPGCLSLEHATGVGAALARQCAGCWPAAWAVWMEQ